MTETLFFAAETEKRDRAEKNRIMRRGECKYAAEYVDDCEQAIIL